MRQTIERMEHYLGQWTYISGREFQDPDRRRGAVYETYGKGVVRDCLNRGISSTVTGRLGGQDFSIMDLADDSELQMTDGPALQSKSFWEFNLRGFLRYRIPFARVAVWVGEGIESFFLYHRAGGVLETDVFLEGEQVTDISQWLERPGGELPRRFTVLGSFREGFRLISGRLKMFGAQAQLERMEDFQPVMAARR